MSVLDTFTHELFNLMKVLAIVIPAVCALLFYAEAIVTKEKESTKYKITLEKMDPDRNFTSVWDVQVRKNGKYVHIAYYNELEDAKRAVERLKRGES